MNFPSVFTNDIVSLSRQRKALEMSAAGHNLTKDEQQSLRINAAATFALMHNMADFIELERKFEEKASSLETKA